MTSLTWDRVDMNNRRAWVPGEQMKTGIPHGIPLSSEAIRLLRTLKKLHPDGDRVFQWNGKPIDDCNTRALQDAVTAANLQPLRWPHRGIAVKERFRTSLDEKNTISAEDFRMFRRLIGWYQKWLEVGNWW